MADDKQFKLVGEHKDKGFPLGGEFTTRLLRAMQADAGYDVSQDRATPQASTFSGQVHGTILLRDATEPPFRRNGRGFSIRGRLPATVGQLNIFLLKHLELTDRFDVLVLDELRVGGGASEFDFGYTIITDNFVAGLAAPELESVHRTTEATGALKAAKVSRFTQIKQGSQSSAGALVDGTDVDTVGGDAYSGAGAHTRVSLGGMLLWPGALFFVEQLTANVALNVTVRGRVVNIGPAASRQQY